MDTFWVLILKLRLLSQEIIDFLEKKYYFLTVEKLDQGEEKKGTSMY